MPTDMEEAVRRSLRARAAGVTPDPRTWRRVQERIRRRRTLRGATVVVVVATVAVLAVMALPGRNGREVRFTPPVVGQPAPTPTAAPDPAANPQALGSFCDAADPPVLVAATFEGDLVVSCASGEEHPVATDTLESEPAFSPDGALLAFTRRPAADAPERVVLLELDTGEETDLGDGYGPAFGPDGQLAWLVDEPGDGVQPSIVVRSEPTGETLLQFPVSGDPAGQVTARHLAWDASGGRLWWETGDEDRGLWTAHLESEGPTPTRVEVSGAVQDSTYRAPSPNLANQAMVLRLCCAVTDGDVPVDAEIGAVRTAGRSVSGERVPGEYQALQGLNELPTALDLSGPLYTAAAGTLDVRRDEEGRAATADGEPLWLPGDAPAWIVGDGNASYLVDGYGDLVQLNAAWSGVAVNPTFAPRTVGEDASPAPEPKEPTTATVQVYFGVEGKRDCTSTRAYERQVEAPAVARGALQALLAGPTRQERAQGATSFFSADTANLLNIVTITEGTARVDFDDRFGDINNASTSCGSEQLLSELDKTVKQFPTVDRTIYSLDGDVAAFYLWLQRVPPETASD
ncbi:MAG: GerMN domain-containing protein [Euzebyales bacterium]|nr:GerMN domain-containing protein [Euzebyales bacterium]